MNKVQPFYRLRKSLRDTKQMLKEPATLFLALAIVAGLFVFVIMPLYNVLSQSVQGDGGLTLAGYRKALSAGNLRALRNSLVLAATVGVIATVIGFIFAYCDSYVKTRGKALFNAVAFMPMISPPFAISLSIIILFGGRGLISYTLLGLRNSSIYGFNGLVFAQTFANFPLAYIMLNGVLKTIDPSIEEAARDCGANRWKVFKQVTLPLALPALANSFLLVFIRSLADFGNPMTIGGSYETLAVQIYMQAIANSNMQVGTAVAMVLLSISLALFVISKYWLEKKTFVTITGKATRARVLEDKPAVVWGFSIFCLGVSVLILGMYLMIPIVSLITTWGNDYTLTFKHYIYAVQVGGKAIKDTLLQSLIATPITGVISMVIAFLVVRKRFIGRSFMELAAMLCIAVPGTVLGISYVTTFNTKPIVLTGTAAIIIISFVVRYMPISVKSGITSLRQIDPSIEESAYDLGANSRKVFTSVTLPLIKPAFFGGLVYTFSKCMTSISAVIFLISAKYNLLTIAILDRVESGKYGEACAYSTILILMVFVVMGILNKLLSFLGTSKQQSVSD